MACPACPGRTTMYKYRWSASSHTASVSFGRNDGGVPRSRSYQAAAAVESRTGTPANRSMVMTSGHHEFGCVDQDQHAAREAPDVREGKVRSARDVLEQV